MIFEYLTGVSFRNGVNTLVEAFTTMQSDLQKEQRAIRVQWATREVQLGKALAAISGIYGELHGIAGQSLQEIASLELSALEKSNVPDLDNEVL